MIYIEHDFEGCKIGKLIDILVTLPGEKTFKAKGKIIHNSITKSHVFGIEFIQIEEDAKKTTRIYRKNDTT